ncbi:MAG: hypothetical protein LBH21_08235 [Gracilibacteraceae bacterium]|jgi:hypothetical protein|nr:hypothetical protein [Gracilibacteraceae bacterium]
MERFGQTMEKFKIVLALWCVCLLCSFFLIACGSTGVPDETATLSPTETYLQATSDEDLVKYFDKATEIRDKGWNFGFSNPADIDSNELFRFANLSGDTELLLSWYNASEQMYYIPVSDITGILDRYLEGYVFNPGEVKYADYNPKDEVLVARALGFGRPGEFSFLVQKSAVDRDTVLVRLRSTMEGFDDFYAEVTARITETGPKFLSCRQIESIEQLQAEEEVSLLRNIAFYKSLSDDELTHKIASDLDLF